MIHLKSNPEIGNVVMTGKPQEGQPTLKQRILADVNRLLREVEIEMKKEHRRKLIQTKLRLARRKP